MCKEANKQLWITELLKPILQNPDKHHVESDMEHRVTLDPKMHKNELAEDEPFLNLRTNVGGK